MKTYSQDNFKQILGLFSKEVREKEYHPLEKDLWFTLKDLTAKTSIIEIWLEDSNMNIRFWREGERYSFHILDESFGSFLHDHEYDVSKPSSVKGTPNPDGIWFTTNMIKDIIRDFILYNEGYLTDDEKSKLKIIFEQDDVTVSWIKNSIMISTTYDSQFFPIKPNSFGEHMYKLYFAPKESSVHEETPKLNDNDVWASRDEFKGIIDGFRNQTGCFFTDDDKNKLIVILKEESEVKISLAKSRFAVMISTARGCQCFPIKPNSFGEYVRNIYFSSKTNSAEISCESDISQLTEAFCKIKDSAQKAMESFSWLNDTTTINDNNRKEENNMNNFINFDFGVMNTCALHMSMYGPAVYNKNNGKYYAYDKENDRMMDVTPINFKMDNMFYKMPTSISALQEGDMIIHVNTPMCVSHVCLELNEIEVIDYFTSEKKIIKPVCNMFGFDYYTKVVCLLDGFKTEADKDNPFGNMWMLAAAGSDGSNMLPLMMLMNKDAANLDPMMMMLLCSKDMSNNDLLPLLLLQNGRLTK